MLAPNENRRPIVTMGTAASQTRTKQPNYTVKGPYTLSKYELLTEIPPDLTLFGLKSEWGRDEPPIADSLLIAEYRGEYDRALSYLRYLEALPSARLRQATSYGLKHDAERYHRKLAPERAAYMYVSNGALIAAAIDEGLPVYRLPRNPKALVIVPKVSSW